MPTINLTSGCTHGCLYCYARGYTIYPGDGTVVVYENTLERLRAELALKRRKPQAVYFSPSSDLFQPVPEVAELGYRILEFLLSQGIGVAFLSKGRIPDKTMHLLLSHADLVRAQIGITTLDEEVRRVFEPNTASPKVRLEQIARLTAGGVATEARLDPVLPGLTDAPDALRQLFSALAKVGVKQATASALFLRPGIVESLRRNVQDKAALQSLLAFYEDAAHLPIRAGRSSAIALPPAIRKDIYGRMGRLAEEHGLHLSICACKNPDLATALVASAVPGQRGPEVVFSEACLIYVHPRERRRMQLRP
jgi:DNA repair photolyase